MHEGLEEGDAVVNEWGHCRSLDHKSGYAVYGLTLSTFKELIIECHAIPYSLITPCNNVRARWLLTMQLEGVVKLFISLVPHFLVLAFTLGFTVTDSSGYLHEAGTH